MVGVCVRRGWGYHTQPDGNRSLGIKVFTINNNPKIGWTLKIHSDQSYVGEELFPLPFNVRVPQRKRTISQG